MNIANTGHGVTDLPGDSKHGGYGHECWDGCEAMTDTKQPTHADDFAVVWKALNLSDSDAIDALTRIAERQHDIYDIKGGPICDCTASVIADECTALRRACKGER